MKAVCLMSGGIDSPVAAYIMSEAGADIILLHMDNRPYADDRPVERAKMLAQRIREETGKDFPLYIAPHGATQKAISDNSDRLYQCVLCKHAMQLTAKKLCQKLGAEAIVMGDSLGQVASQTLLNIRSEIKGVDFTILRPLIGYDKQEIIDIAQRIGTFDISNMPAVGCTALPKKVVTEADIAKTQQYYDACDIGKLAEISAEKAERVS